jgi:hypothetical protein
LRIRLRPLPPRTLQKQIKEGQPRRGLTVQKTGIGPERSAWPSIYHELAWMS